jgi:hypothetical protein
VHRRTIQINHQPNAKIFQFIILRFVYSSTCFGRFPAHHQELNDCSSSHWFYLCIVVTVVLCSWSGRPVGPTTNRAQQRTEELLHQVGDLFELNIKLWCQKVKEHHSVLDAGNLFRLCGILLSPGMNLYFLLIVRSYHHSLAAGYDKRKNAAYVFEKENTSIKPKPLE